jgi:2-dehydro-3-deoxygluconokinase
VAERRFDVTTIGEALLRLSVPSGERLERMRSLDVSVGGAEANVSVALARMGQRVAWVSRLPRSPLGRLVERTIHGNGVDTSGVIWMDDGRLGTYFIEYAAAPRRIEVVYDRANSLAASMGPEDVDWDFLLDTRVLHLTGITPGLSQACLALVREACERARRAGIVISFDVNYRAKIWSASTAAEALLPLMRMSDIVICGRNDATTLFQLEDAPETTLRSLRDRIGSHVVILTLGQEGSIALDENATLLHQPALRCDIVDRIGAGDAFSAGVLCGWLQGSLAVGLRLGTAMAAHKLTTFGDMLAATRQEIEVLAAGEENSRPLR